MLYSAVFSQIHVPPVILLGHAVLFDSGFEHIVSLFSLAASDDLADSRNQQIACCNGFAVIIESHVESLYFLRIIRYKYRLLEDLLCNIPFMLSLKIDSPFYRILEVFSGFLQDIYRFRICDPFEIGINDIVEPVDQTLVYEFTEKLHLLRCVFHHVINDVFYHGLCHVHIVSKLCERHFRFDHPELRCVSCRIGVFRSECRSECVHVSECQSKCLRFKLSAYRQACLLAEKVISVIHSAVFSLRQVFHIERRHLEHLSGAFTVACRDYRRMDIYEVVFLEEFMDGICRQRTHPEHCRERIAPRSQVSDLSQELHAVSLFLQRIVSVRTGFYHDFPCLDLKRLLCIGSQHEGSRHLQSCRDRGLCYFLEIIEKLRFIHHLNGLEEASVIELYKSEFI